MEAEKLFEEYTKAFKAMGVIENKLVQELQRYVDWGEIVVGFTSSVIPVPRFIPVVKVKYELYEMPLKEFVEHIKEHGEMTREDFRNLTNN